MEKIINYTIPSRLYTFSIENTCSFHQNNHCAQYPKHNWCMDSITYWNIIEIHLKFCYYGIFGGSLPPQQVMPPKYELVQKVSPKDLEQHCFNKVWSRVSRWKTTLTGKKLKKPKSLSVFRVKFVISQADRRWILV